MRKTAMLCVTLLAALGLSDVVQANEIGNYTSDTNIGFSPGHGARPVDPDDPDPDDPVTPLPPDPKDVIPKGTDGPLSIDFVSSFDFGINPISNKDQVYFAKAQTYVAPQPTTANYAQVTDNRGSGSGWILKVIQQTQFTHANEGNNSELKGASISLKNAILDSKGDYPAPTSQETLSIIPGEETIVATAAKGTGMGTWVVRWGNSAELKPKENSEELLDPNVQLFVPGETPKYAGSYTTTLTWTLSELPNN